MSESETGAGAGAPQGAGNEDRTGEPVGRLSQERQLDAAEKIGHGLGKAFGMFKKTRIYQRNARAFREELEKKD